MDDLDDLLTGAKAVSMPPSEALMARVLADAGAVQAGFGVAQMALAELPRAGWLAQLAAVFGGAGALAGVGTAAVVGLFFGFVQPDGIGAVADMLVGAEVAQVDLMPQLDLILAEE